MTAAVSPPPARSPGALAFRLLGRVMGFDPFSQLAVRHYALAPRNWPEKLTLRIVVLADIHACTPWMDAARVGYIVDRANALAPDIVLLPGDFVTALGRLAGQMAHRDWTGQISRLAAPLGVHAVLGNHDWREDHEAQARGAGPCDLAAVLGEAGVRVYENDAARLEKDGACFWLVGLGDQRAFRVPNGGKRMFRGVDDLDAALAQISDTAPAILMAHEPDIFPRVPESVSLTISGHTHGGQIKLFGRTPVVPSDFGSRYVHGHIREGGKDLVVSAGLGCSGLPIRFGVRPEIVVIELA